MKKQKLKYRIEEFWEDKIVYPIQEVFWKLQRIGEDKRKEETREAILSELSRQITSAMNVYGSDYLLKRFGYDKMLELFGYDELLKNIESDDSGSLTLYVNTKELKNGYHDDTDFIYHLHSEHYLYAIMNFDKEREEVIKYLCEWANNKIIGETIEYVVRDIKEVDKMEAFVSWGSMPEYEVFDDGIYKKSFRVNTYEKVLSKEVFVEAFNKFILSSLDKSKDNCCDPGFYDDSNIGKKYSHKPVDACQELVDTFGRLPNCVEYAKKMSDVCLEMYKNLPAK